MRRLALSFLGIVILASPLAAQSADEIIARYLHTIGGREKLSALHTLRRSGRFDGGGGFQAVVVQENKRPNEVREEFSIQGMTGINAYDGKTGWKIEPWQGKKDPEPLGEDEMRDMLEDADFDGPLVDYRTKGNRVEYVGMEPVEGTDTYKVKVTQANGDSRIFFMDTDSYVPIKIESTRIVRGAERQSETILGDYKQVEGVYFPFSLESGPKGSQQHSKITFTTIQANVPIDDHRFMKPSGTARSPQDREGQPVDASQSQPKKEDEQKKPEGAPPPPQPNPPSNPPAIVKGMR